LCLSCSNRSILLQVSDVVKGLEWVGLNHKLPAVVTMSLGVQVSRDLALKLDASILSHRRLGWALCSQQHSCELTEAAMTVYTLRENLSHGMHILSQYLSAPALLACGTSFPDSMRHVSAMCVSTAWIPKLMFKMMNHMSHTCYMRPKCNRTCLQAGQWSQTLQSAVTNLIQKHGITVVVATGNDQVDACQITPANVNGTIAAAGSDMSNKFNPPQSSDYELIYEYDNTGACVDVFAPGVDILAACGGAGEFFK